ncbi:hypothetical protein FACS189425_06730 [Clostridia bacterium]|nr:hypothetical protein FACS189425_06730 [Clostridia bacterium]
MSKARNPERDSAKQRYLQSGGKLSTKENAAQSGVTESILRKWKSQDKWIEALGDSGTDGRAGNHNAKGSGAPERNQNAATHGAYTTMHLENLTPECRAYVESIERNAEGNMLHVLQLLYAKEFDLRRKIKALESEEPGVLHIEHVKEYDDGKGSPIKTETYSASSFEHIMRLEMELNRNRGRITRQIDALSSYEMDRQRLDLEERKYNLSKQKLSGEYTMNPETGEIDDRTVLEAAI